MPLAIKGCLQLLAEKQAAGILISVPHGISMCCYQDELILLSTVMLVELFPLLLLAVHTNKLSLYSISFGSINSDLFPLVLIMTATPSSTSGSKGRPL